MISYADSDEHPRLVLAAGLRTPMVRAGGAFAKEDAGHLGSMLARELLIRAGLDPADLDEVIVGCVGPPHDQANIARVIGLRAGVPEPIPARTVARNCASGIESVTTAASNILAGLGDTYLCMGVEVMSAYPLIFGDKMTEFFAKLMKARSLGQRLSTLSKFRFKHLKPRVALLEGLTDPTTGMIMGKTAELLARDWGLSREECDQFALQSHWRARGARDRGRFKREIMPTVPLGARSDSASIRHDDGIRDDQSIENLAKLRPYFERPDGLVTVGNACGITDCAAGLILTTEARAKELGLQPMAAIRSFAWAGLDPKRMGLGPVFSSAVALKAAGMELSDVGVIELNEAFAAQVLACIRASASNSFAQEHLGRDRALGEIEPAKLNVNGGAIALGHPVGATGTRLLMTLAHELQVADKEVGLATLCIGGGQGGAVVLERLS
ncbi:MAG: thiolase family protein [Planctomycetota bacterium]|jgi:acetyl-CoA C-acetyltransferase/acetyl-CoA acyltransferase|nr:thiolase family protein [Planctomycetota bacterium]